MKKDKIDKIWGITLLIIGILTFAVGIISIIGSEIIPHWLRMIIAIIQIVAGIVLIVLTLIRSRLTKK